MKKTIWVTLVIVLCAVGVAGGSYYAFRDNGDAFVYEQKEVARGDVESIVNATGALEPVNTVIVGTEVSGQISELLVDFNDTVEQGQIIARIDARTFEARHLQREADLEVANANIVSRNAELTRAKSNLRRAQSELSRRVELSQEGHVSDSELELDRNTLEQALAAREIAEASVTNAKAGLTQAEASLAQSSLDLERTNIRAPISGTVINRAVEIGQTVAASFSAPELFVIAHDLHEMKVEASVDEADVGRLRDGLFARFTVDAYPDREFRGRVSQIRKSPNENQSVVTYKVIVTARNDDLSLYPGMTANVEIVLGSRQDVLTVPNSALTYAPRNSSGDTPTTRSGSSFGGGGSSGGRGGFMTPAQRADQLGEQLDLSDEQKAKVATIYETMSQRMREMMMSAGSRGGGPPGRGGGNDMRQRMTNMFLAVNEEISELLEPEQRAKFEEMNAALSGNRQTVYVLNENGIEEQKSIVIGLQDDNQAEVVSGLEEGTSVIVRAKRVTT
ncbi:MAG: efflux RND transporter periplasmic adaptor subunit [Gammaproteobacteria bacterium]|nr:efflux RND transporter periplasmic adaptor subunit [Gammaproteobacteria bacterium]